MLDTGAAYRALAATAIARGIDLDDEDAIADVLNDWQLSIALDPEHRQVSADGVDVTETIREPRISAAVSQVARVAAVRMVLNESFRDMVAHSGLPGVVVEGRDITTVVAPDAPVRILLTASEEVRAARRARELGDADTANVADDMTKRDAADSRVVEFMTAAEGVITIDSSNLTFQQTVDAVIAVIRDAEAAAR
jgi:cytidylate kinase